MAKQAKKEETITEQAIPAQVIGALADKFGKSFLTIQRWIEAKDIRLTTPMAQEVFADNNIEWDLGTA